MAELLLDIKAEVAATPAPAMSLPADRLLQYGAKYDTITNFDEFVRTLVALCANAYKFVQFVTEMNGYKLSSF